MPDAKKHSDNPMIMVQPIIRARNLEFGHCIAQNIPYMVHHSTGIKCWIWKFKLNLCQVKQIEILIIFRIINPLAAERPFPLNKSPNNKEFCQSAPHKPDSSIRPDPDLTYVPNTRPNTEIWDHKTTYSVCYSGKHKCIVKLKVLKSYNDLPPRHLKIRHL